MKLNIVKIEAEGTAQEFAEALPSLLNPEISQVPAAGVNTLTGPAPELREPREPAYVLEAPHAEVVTPHREAGHAPSDGGGPVGQDTVATDAARGGSPTSHPAHEPVTFDEKPRDWEDIPGELRVWNAIGTCCHIAKNPNDLYVTWCGHDTGKVRPADMEPRTQAEPCGNCLRRMQEANRP